METALHPPKRKFNIRTWLHNTWVTCLIKLCILIPYGDEEAARMNVRNPAAYIAVALTMIVVWLVEVIETIVVSVCGGFYNLVAVYIRTVRKGYDDEQQAKLMQIKDMLSAQRKANKTVDPPLNKHINNSSPKRKANKIVN